MGTRGTQGFVAGLGGRAVLFPWSAVFPDRDDRRGAAHDHRAVTAASVAGAVGGQGADVLVLRVLLEQVRQEGTVAFPTGCELDGADVRSGGVHGQMHLAPWAAALNAMLAGLPLPVAEELIPLAMVSRTIGVPMARCPPTGSAARRRGDMGSAPAGSSASGMASRSPEPANQAQTGAEGSRPSGGLPERQLEQHLDRQAELDCVRRENSPPDCFLILLTPKRSAGVLDGPRSVRAAPYPDHARPAETRACGAQRFRGTSWSCNSGRAWACSCNPSNRMDSRCESVIARVLQQYPSIGTISDKNTIESRHLPR